MRSKHITVTIDLDHVRSSAAAIKAHTRVALIAVVVLAGALILMGLLVILKHRANIGRLLQGTEPRIAGKRK